MYIHIHSLSDSFSIKIITEYWVEFLVLYSRSPLASQPIYHRVHITMALFKNKAFVFIDPLFCHIVKGYICLFKTCLLSTYTAYYIHESKFVISFGQLRHKFFIVSPPSCIFFSLCDSELAYVSLSYSALHTINLSSLYCHFLIYGALLYETMLVYFAVHEFIHYK